MNVFNKSGGLNRQLDSAVERLTAELNQTKRGDIKFHGLRFWALRRGNHRELCDRSWGLRTILWHFDIDFREENEAPRGGQAGYLLVIPTAERRKVRRALDKMRRAL